MSTAPQQPTYIIPPPAGANWKTPLLIVVIFLLAGFNLYLYLQLGHLRTDTKTAMDKMSQEMSITVERLRADSSEAVQKSQRRVEALQGELSRSQRSARQLVGQAKVDAEQRVATLQDKIASEQAVQQQALSAVKATADTATTRLANVSTDVQNTKSQLDQTIANLKKASGDIDNHTSLIATNGKELQALRELGERNYSEFTLTKSKKPQKVGDVMVEVKKVDVRHNRFTIVITADDKQVEKKDRTLNEPIQFYTLKARQPDEIVVNQLKKDTIVGYLAAPKVQNSRAGAGS